MTHKILLFLFLVCALATIGCKKTGTEGENAGNTAGAVYTDVAEDSIFVPATDEAQKLAETLVKTKFQIDSAIVRKEKQILVYAKLKGVKELIPVDDFEHWPNDIEITYNIIKSQDKKVRYIEEIPYSETGEWDNIYTHYFDEKGRTMIFEFSSTFYNSECTQAALNELSTYYFDENFRLIKKDYEVKALSGEVINPEHCHFKYRFDYNIHRNIDELQAIYHFKKDSADGKLQ